MATTVHLQGARQDDVLECFLYPKFCFTTNPEQVTETLLADEISKYNQVIDKYTNDYIWHRDSLVFRPRTKQALLLEKVLEGSAITDGSYIFYSLRAYVLLFNDFLQLVSEIYRSLCTATHTLDPAL